MNNNNAEHIEIFDRDNWEQCCHDGRILNLQNVRNPLGIFNQILISACCRRSVSHDRHERGQRIHQSRDARHDCNPSARQRGPAGALRLRHDDVRVVVLQRRHLGHPGDVAHQRHRRHGALLRRLHADSREHVGVPVRQHVHSHRLRHVWLLMALVRRNPHPVVRRRGRLRFVRQKPGAGARNFLPRMGSHHIHDVDRDIASKRRPGHPLHLPHAHLRLALHRRVQGPPRPQNQAGTCLPKHCLSESAEVFEHKSVKILVPPSPTGHMLSSLGFSSLICGTFHRFL